MSEVDHYTGERPPPVDLWDQYRDEPDTDYARFLVYLRLGAGRDLDAAAAETGLAKHICAFLRDRWSWERRAAAWDEHERCRLAAARHAARDRAAGVATTAALGAMQTASAAITHLSPEVMGAKSVAELMNAGAATARWALGDPGAYATTTGDSAGTLSALAADPAVPVDARIRAASGVPADDGDQAPEHIDVSAALGDALAGAPDDVQQRVAEALTDTARGSDAG